MTGARRSPVDSWAPYALLALLVAAWIALAAAVPVVNNRQVVIDVSCSSGNPAVGVWVESATGGSWWAERGASSSGPATRYTYTQPFTGEYQVNVGCGGTELHWGVTAKSDSGTSPHRRLVCDDHVAGTTAGRCLDRATG